MDQAEYILSFESTYDAMLAEQALLKADIPVGVMPLPASIRAGCGICLRIGMAVWPQASQLLALQPIRPPSPYLRTTAGGKSHYAPIIEGVSHEST